ncbi:MAG: hypothetical protein GXP14_09445 [Gammaproteobacteria bacterium]|nr:hypothetical protein [Gammaproteobacteria bacterium]
MKQSLLLGSNVVVSGTYCLYAYEAAAGVRINSDVVATRDIDLLWDSRSRLRLVSTQKLEGMLGLLQKVDQSFLRSKQMYRAVNSEGFMVDLIKPVPNPPSRVESVAMGGDADLQAAELFSQRWMVSAPKMKQLVIGMDGVPVCMVVPDPRVFALHKLWLSEQTEREPMKKRRDRAQALLVAELVVRYLPQFQFQENELRMFPRSVLKMLDELPPCFT